VIPARSIIALKPKPLILIKITKRNADWNDYCFFSLNQL